MEKLCLSGAIMALKRTPAEKILLAYICQQAATSSGQCTDSNKELGQAVAMHPQTVSDLVNKLRDILSMTSSADNPVAGQRILTPPVELVAAYQPVSGEVDTPPKSFTYPPLSHSLTPTLSQSLTPLSDWLTPPKPIAYPPSDNNINVYSTPSDNSPNVYSPASSEQPPVADQPRQCVLTGLDISQQVGKEDFVNRQTIRELRQSEPALFKELAAQLLSPEDVALLAGDPDALVLRMAARLRRLANLRAEEAALARASFRECPISGADITHQGIHYPFVTAETLNNLIRHDRPAFAQVVSRLGLPDQSAEPLTTQCRTVLWRVRQLASTHVPAYPIIYAPQAATESGPAPSGGRRYCPITSIDITHQQERHRFATAWTIEALYKSNRPGFDQLAGKLLSDSLRQGSPADQCFALSGRIKRLAKAYQ